VSNKKNWKQLYTLITCFALILMLLPSTIIHATGADDKAIASKLYVETEVGYNGMYPQNTSVPVKIKLTNLISRDLKGDLVLNIRNNNGYSVAHIVPLEITSGSTVEANLAADGSFSKLGTWVQFYEGGVGKGDSIELSGTRYVEGRSITGNNVIGIVASDPDTLNFVAMINSFNGNLIPLVLEEDFYASSHHDLSMFNVIALNDVATAQWPEKKVKALKDWVASGGTLLVGGGAGYSQTAAAFQELLPVEGQNTVVWNNTELLMNYAESAEQPDPLNVINGKLVRGEVLLADSNIPILASNQYGSGSILYIAFDLGLKPLSNWEGRTAFIQNVLNPYLINANAYNGRDTWWELENSASQFPRLKSPQVGGLLLIFIIYVLIVAPIMYMVLRKLDRREWSWWLIPSLAVISTVVIVFIGTRDKSDLYVHAVKIAQINGNNVTETAMNKVFIPNSKDITIQLPDQSYPRFGSDNYYNNNSEVDTKKYKRINYDGDSRSVTFTDNKYWTTQTYMYDKQVYDVAQYGGIDATYEKLDSGPALIIRNNSHVEMKHLSLIANAQLYYIGALAAGEEITYNLPSSFALQPTAIRGMNSVYGGRYYGGNYSSSLVNMSNLSWEQLQRETALLDSNSYLQNSASLIAFSYDDTKKYVVNNKNVKTDELTLWTVNIADQLLNEFQNQQAIVPSSYALEGSGSYSAMGENYISLNEGALIFKYFVPQRSAGGTGQVVGQVVPDINASQFGATFSIFNVQTGQWEEISKDKADLTQYLTDINMLQVKLENSQQNYYEGSLPVLLIDREVQ